LPFVGKKMLGNAVEFTTKVVIARERIDPPV